MSINAEISKADEAALKEKEEKLKAAARAEARRISITFDPVLTRAVTLDAFMLGQPPLIRDREKSIIHIQRVFSNESPLVQRELVQHLFWPHVYAVLKAAEEATP